MARPSRRRPTGRLPGCPRCRRELPVTLPRIVVKAMAESDDNSDHLRCCSRGEAIGQLLCVGVASFARRPVRAQVTQMNGGRRVSEGARKGAELQTPLLANVEGR